MLKYRGTYRVHMPLDNKGNSTENIDDTYLLGNHKTQVYRYNDNALAVMFISTGYCNNRLKDFDNEGIKYKLLQDGDDESVYIFDESELSKVADILKIRTNGAKKSPVVRANKKKRELSEEQLTVLRERMKKMQEINKKNKENKVIE